jgi:cell division protein FtsB
VSSGLLLDILIGFVTVVLAGAGTVGAWAALRVGKNTTTVSNYREAAQSWRLKSEAQDAEIRELQTENADLKKQLADLSGQVGVLRDMVTGTAVIAEHDTRVTNYHAEVMTQLAVIQSLLKGNPSAA